MVNPPESSVNLKNRLKGILTDGQISDRLEILSQYARDYSFHGEGKPLLVVFLENKEEVQAMLRPVTNIR